MKKLIGLVVLGVTLCTAVTGCVVVPARGYYAPHPYYYRY
ncbi:putative membrane protein [Collimonas arenae]|uniref:Putative membrane protein n=1 Tax=Collimonas arenae TaxID=279058 RepID=A0A127QMG0_9BURK|nr:putative membrane protein [Collimonas arenae]AMP11224.1 putative membrane protein [Collimonas arenae]